ncbi:MAG: hypothetical protein RBS56_03345 [Candidatus Gracilibacteria bacterium]|jgi:hypothetical protein|nr:hypothetical protein [Candidatus Gracilibacteria bacterium]
MPEQKKSTQLGAQTYLPIAEIRDNTLVLKSGGIRSVLKTNAINFNLKSEDEQTAIILSYQAFLNSLEFPIQILIKSKKLDLDDYIEQVKKRADEQTNKLLQEQTYEYAQYIKRLIEYADIMEKNFFVIVPYDIGTEKTTSIWQSFFRKLSPKDSFTDILRRHKDFDEHRKKLTQRVTQIKSNLENCNLKVEELTTEELIDLFYKAYNPITSQTVKLKNLSGSSIVTDEEKLRENSELIDKSEEKI